MEQLHYSALRSLTIAPDLALEFLGMFSRFEFALKATTFRQQGAVSAIIRKRSFLNLCRGGSDIIRAAGAIIRPIIIKQAERSIVSLGA